jgi:hypothetical protein
MKTYSRILVCILAGLVTMTVTAQTCLDQCGAESDTFPDACSPIVINFAHEYELTGREAAVWFDINGSGTPVHLGWTAAGGDEAFLWLDRNHNGGVTSGAELFGNFTPLKNGRTAANGFEALKEDDSNHDGVIDVRDDIWPRLMLWRDENHDALSQPNEIATVVGSGLTGIELRYHWTGRPDRWGNGFRYEAKAWIQNPGGSPSPRPLYDIFFVRVK